MKHDILHLLSATTFVVTITATAVVAGPPSSFHLGPPSGVFMGPSAGANMGTSAAMRVGPPTGVPLEQPPNATDGAAARADTGPNAFHSRGLDGTSRTSLNSSMVSREETVGSKAKSTSLADAAKFLGKLNAAHASSTALSHASSRSIVGALASYRSQTLSAQSKIDTYSSLINADEKALLAAQTQLATLEKSGTASQNQITEAQAQLSAAQQKLSLDENQLNAAQAELISAKNTLQATTKRQLTPQVIAKVNVLLGISPG